MLEWEVNSVGFFMIYLCVVDTPHKTILKKGVVYKSRKLARVELKPLAKGITT